MNELVIAMRLEIDFSFSIVKFYKLTPVRRASGYIDNETGFIRSNVNTTHLNATLKKILPNIMNT